VSLIRSNREKSIDYRLYEGIWFGEASRMAEQAPRVVISSRNQDACD